MATVPAAGPTTSRFRLPPHLPGLRLERWWGTWRANFKDISSSSSSSPQISEELDKLVVENVLAFNEGFWIRLAARTDTCKSEDDKAWFFYLKDYEELAVSIMSIVDRLVHKTNEKIESATDILKEILKPVVDGTEEVSWPPRDPEALVSMEKEIARREQEGQLDEGFLSEVNAHVNPKEMETSQVLRPCYKKSYKFMLPKFFASVLMHTKGTTF